MVYKCTLFYKFNSKTCFIGLRGGGTNLTSINLQYFFVCFCFEFCHVCPHLHDCYLIFCVGFDVIQKRVFFFVFADTATLKRLSVTVRDHQTEQRPDVSGPGFLRCRPTLGHAGKVTSGVFQSTTQPHTQRLNAVADVLCMCSFSPTRQETVEQLLSNIFDQEKNESAIVSVIQILLTLFETRRPA